METPGRVGCFTQNNRHGTWGQRAECGVLHEKQKTRDMETPGGVGCFTPNI